MAQQKTVPEKCEVECGPRTRHLLRSGEAGLIDGLGHGNVKSIAFSSCAECTFDASGSASGSRLNDTLATRPSGTAKYALHQFALFTRPTICCDLSIVPESSIAPRGGSRLGRRPPEAGLARSLDFSGSSGARLRLVWLLLHSKMST